MHSLAAHFLIAPSQLRDPDFGQTVLLMIQHSEEQAVGIILNRPTNKTVREVWSGKKRPECDQPVYYGGPVPGPLMALHDDPSFAEIRVLPGVHYSVQKKNLEELVLRPGGVSRIFDSHAGWGPGQLERWIEAGGWLVVPARADLVFDTGPGLWEETLKLV